MLPLRVAVLSGYTGPRSSMFAGAASDIFSMGAGKMGARSDAEWYAEAKEEVAEYDDLVMRTRKIANKPVREQLAAEYFGDPNDDDSAVYRRNSVASNIAEAEQYTPVNALVFGQPTVLARVQKLKDWNASFKDDVLAAEAAWGSLPAPQVIETISTVQVSTVPGWVPVVVVGALGLAALSAMGVFGKGK